MPQEDGFTLMKRLRELESQRAGSVVSIALTAFARDEDRLKTRAAGFKRHLAKPLDPLELISIVREVVDETKRQSNA